MDKLKKRDLETLVSKQSWACVRGLASWANYTAADLVDDAAYLIATAGYKVTSENIGIYVDALLAALHAEAEMLRSDVQQVLASIRLAAPGTHLVVPTTLILPKEPALDDCCRRCGETFGEHSGAECADEGFFAWDFSKAD